MAKSAIVRPRELISSDKFFANFSVDTQQVTEKEQGNARFRLTEFKEFINYSPRQAIVPDFFEEDLMSSLTDKAIEVDRCNIIMMGNTPYVMIPKFLRRETGPKAGDEVLFFRTTQTEDGESIIRIDKQTPEKVSERPA